MYILGLCHLVSFHVELYWRYLPILPELDNRYKIYRDIYIYAHGIKVLRISAWHVN